MLHMARDNKHSCIETGFLRNVQKAKVETVTVHWIDEALSLKSSKPIQLQTDSLRYNQQWTHALPFLIPSWKDYVDCITC